MKTIVTVITVAAVLLLSGCNTVKGVGQDIQRAGEKLEDAAKK